MNNLNSRELATIIAALRYWQRRDSADTEMESDIATDGGETDALQVDEIDKLVERLNRPDAAIAGDPIQRMYDEAFATTSWRCGACGHTSDEPFDRCEACFVPDQCYENE